MEWAVGPSSQSREVLLWKTLQRGHMASPGPPGWSMENDMAASSGAWYDLLVYAAIAPAPGVHPLTCNGGT